VPVFSPAHGPGYRDLAKLAVTVERDLDRHHPPTPTAHTPTKETATLATA
jgi:hypothetical protein